MCDCEPFQSCTECAFAFPKPGKPKKSRKKPIKTGRNLKPPKKKHCRYLGYETGTECFRHAESRIIKFLDGGGITGSRINDNLTAWLSDEADRKFSKHLKKGATEQEETEHALQWAILIIKTHLLD